MLLSLAGVGLTETLEGDIEKIMKYLLSRFAGLFIAVTLLLSSLLGYGAAPALAAVGLTSFEVTPAGNNTDLRITWTTETEVDTIAFRLKRSTATDAASATDVVTLPALGAGVGGGSYEHIDRGLTTGTAYYYWLYEVTTSGDVSPIGERINATPGQSPGVTPAPTNTQSATATPPLRLLPRPLKQLRRTTRLAIRPPLPRCRPTRRLPTTRRFPPTHLRRQPRPTRRQSRIHRHRPARPLTLKPLRQQPT